jgi:hypothetical protein
MPAPARSRRQFLRLSNQAGKFRVEVGRPLSTHGILAFTGHDLSVYGLSFVAQPRHTYDQLIAPGLMLQQMAFEIEGRRLVVDARVQYVRDLPPPKGTGPLLKIGVEFVNIGAEDVWYLSEYIVRKGLRKGPRGVRGLKKPRKAAKGKKAPKARKKAVKRKPKAKARRRKGGRR